MSSTQIRNRATLGGNIMTASPAADAVPPLLAAAASLVLAGPKGEREVLLSDFLLGPGKTALAESEVLTHILLPVEGGRGRSHFIKVGQRNAMAISVVNFAGWTKVNPNGRVDDIRIVLGAVAPTAIRARRAEQAIISTTPDSNTLAEAARLAAEECRPISDLRGTAAGRRLLVEAWTLRLLQQLLGNQSSAGYQS
jgi:CO/xanthine dehydrogenase FAD-binding subunit